jgi:hypothetical protein
VICFAGTADPVVPFDHNGATAGAACINRVLVRQGVYSVLKPFPGMGHGMGSNDLRYDTLITMAAQFANHVLFTSVTSTKRGENISFTQDQPNAFNRILIPTNRIPSHFGMVYSLSGRAICAGTDINISRMSHKACGIYIVQPVQK